MKALIMFSLMAAAAVSLAEDAGDKVSSDEAAQIAAEEKLFYETEGGVLTAPYKGRRLNIVNTQTILDEAKVRELAGRITGEMQTGILVTSNEKAEWPRISLVEDASPRLVVAPEDASASINVKALSKDGADRKVVCERVMKELWRAYAYIFGAAECEFGPGITDLVVNLEELDRLACGAPHPAMQNSIFKNTARLGVGVVRSVTYRQACSEGWAPAPTNDILKAIWDKVHEIPSKPMKITYDKAAQKPVVK